MARANFPVIVALETGNLLGAKAQTTPLRNVLTFAAFAHPFDFTQNIFARDNPIRLPR